MMSTKLLAAGVALAFATFASQAQGTQGVSSNEILVGSIQDLSGPIAAYGKHIRNGMTMAADELNAAGGVQGRKFKLLFEDSAYDPRKAALAAQKLVNQERIFAMVGHIGTAQNNAAMPIQFEKNVLNFFPVTAAREMYEPFHRLKYAFAATYYDQVRAALPRMIKEKNASKICTIYQDDEFGLEVLRGGEAALNAPVSASGSITLPWLPFTTKASVSTRSAVLLPSWNLKLSVSPPALAYTVAWNMLLPAYAPNGADEAELCTPRTCEPTNTPSVPVVCSTPPTVTRAVRVMVSEKSLAITLQSGVVCRRRPMAEMLVASMLTTTLDTGTAALVATALAIANLSALSKSSTEPIATKLDLAR